MQITTATRTVEIYANNEAGITYRNVKDGKVTGPVRTADRATAKAGSVGREILDAIDAQAAAEAEAEIVAETAVEVTEMLIAAEIAAPVAAEAEVATQVAAYVGRYGVSADHIRPQGQVTEREAREVSRRAADRIRRAVGLRW